MAEGCGSLFCRLRLIYNFAVTRRFYRFKAFFRVAVEHLFYNDRIFLYLKLQITNLFHYIQNHLQIIKAR